jgi:sterol desaturase/sphingolipid hydroxylase (fatty acid hydroxylase superfamily)
LVWIFKFFYEVLALPKGKIGVNFGISLSLWDYLFNTHHVPYSDGSVKLGFPGDEKLPSSFLKQLLYGFKKPNK